MSSHSHVFGKGTITARGHSEVMRSAFSKPVAGLLVLLVLVTGSRAIPEPGGIIATPSLPRPGYLQAVRDPVFGTTIVRVTEPGAFLGAGVRCEPDYCRHRYSSTQAWNADQSLFVVANGCNGTCFLDGHDFKPKFHRDNSDDCKWHPTDPEIMVCVTAKAVYAWRPRADTSSALFIPTDYTDLSFGPYKGNLSIDGSHLVLRARNLSGHFVAFAYDIANKKKHSDISVDDLPGKNGYCGISPSARYIACFQTTDDGKDIAHVFTLEGERLQEWTEHHRPGHGDMTIDADGEDVYIGISKADPDKWHIIKRRLRDGRVTVLAPAGYATHASTRGISRSGWVFLTYEGSEDKVKDSPGWTPYYREVVAMRTDGSGTVLRIAQTHNVRSDYYSESHVSPSPDGSMVVWSSNWETGGGPIADYVAMIDWDRTSYKPPASP